MLPEDKPPQENGTYYRYLAIPIYKAYIYIYMCVCIHFLHLIQLYDYRLTSPPMTSPGGPGSPFGPNGSVVYTETIVASPDLELTTFTNKMACATHQ